GVVGDLSIVTVPSGCRTTMSVKVPPVSIPTIWPLPAPRTTSALPIVSVPSRIAVYRRYEMLFHSARDGFAVKLRLGRGSHAMIETDNPHPQRAMRSTSNRSKTPSKRNSSARYRVEAVSRAAALLRDFTSAMPRHSEEELARRHRMSATLARRTLLTLAQHG